MTRDNSPDQVANVATLPGIVGHSMAMPDIHPRLRLCYRWCRRLLMPTGVLSRPGGVGYDINCGGASASNRSRCRGHQAETPETDRHPLQCRTLGRGIFGAYPPQPPPEIDRVLTHGARWAVNQGYGWDEDLERIEETGEFEGANPDVVSRNAKKRGGPQLGTLGAGQTTSLKFRKWSRSTNLILPGPMVCTKTGQVVIMIHNRLARMRPSDLYRLSRCDASGATEIRHSTGR